VAVIAGVIVSALVFAWDHAKRIEIYSRKKDDQEQTYEILGSLFFGSTQNFLEAFNPHESPNDVYLDFGKARVCDHSAVEAIHALTERFRNAGKTLHLQHLSPDCSILLDKMGDLVEVNKIEDPKYKLAVDELG
jgi:SulP family sulfate permease